MELSIIIPTKNEEKYLVGLLESIKNQKLKIDFEIIISDSDSTDKTKEIALKYGCILIQGGIPSVGRNNGAKYATGKYLLFLDADTLLEYKSIETWLYKLKNEYKKIATPYIRLRDDENNIIAKLYYFISSNIGYNMGGCVFGTCMIFEKELFNKIGGFNKEIYLLEDVEIFKRAKKYSKRINLYPFIQTSARRFDKIGNFKMIYYTFYLYILSILGIYKKKNESNFNMYKL